jgi:hypothetical protein
VTGKPHEDGPKVIAVRGPEVPVEVATVCTQGIETPASLGSSDVF